MTTNVENILARYEAVHQEALDVVNRAGMERMVYSDLDWTVRDVVINIFFWEKEAVRSMDAYLNDQEYSLSGFSEEDVDEINDRAREAYRAKSDANLIDEWNDTHDVLRELYSQLDESRLKGKLMAPWKMVTKLSRFMEEMSVHEEEHINDIKKLVEGY